MDSVPGLCKKSFLQTAASAVLEDLRGSGRLQQSILAWDRETRGAAFIPANIWNVSKVLFALEGP